MKYYAVRGGLEGNKIYTTWAECEKNVKGVADVRYKRFGTKQDALDFMNNVQLHGYEQLSFDMPGSGTETTGKKAEAYVDGSYNIDTCEYACGVVMLIDNREICMSHKYDDPGMAKMRNVAGEIEGAMEAVKWALEHDVKFLTIYHDYQGISSWPDGDWNTNNRYTLEYAAYVTKAREYMDVTFVKVKGHSGDVYNDMADRLAKDALGIR